MTTKNKRARRYADYIVENKGQLYAAVHLPQGGGKYKKKHILLAKIGGAQNAAKWAAGELIKHRMEQLDAQISEIYHGVLDGSVSLSAFKDKVLRLENV